MVSCPTTEGNLGDGYLPAMAINKAGVPLAIGSDSQVRIDPFEEARELETCRGASPSSGRGCSPPWATCGRCYATTAIGASA